MVKQNRTYTDCVLGEIAEVFTGFSPYGRSPAGKGNQVQRLISIKNIQGGRVLTDDVETVTVEDPTKLDAYRLREGDILLSARGSSFRAGVCGEVASGLVAGSNTLVIRLRDGAPLGPWLLANMLNMAKGASLLSSLAEGAAIQSIKPQRVLALHLSVPPKETAMRLEEYCLQYMIEQQAALNKAAIHKNIINGLLSPLLSLQD